MIENFKCKIQTNILFKQVHFINLKKKKNLKIPSTHLNRNKLLISCNCFDAKFMAVKVYSCLPLYSVAINCQENNFQAVSLLKHVSKEHIYR